ncbi:cyclin-domain-containing protein [Apodospora peruviana]|uniref:Cyclin-domain-containing protein n=1 Tax=Apodospora peruviana TaxID=516989 RepID=A0AAE0IBI9_9PEZI|nr:cyclin-domain-containing protein [Apodospora peruviana]
MAALISDVFSDTSRFHNIIGASGIPHPHAHDSRSYQSRSVSRSRNQDAHQPHHPRPSASASPRRQGSATSATPRYPSQTRREPEWEETVSEPNDNNSAQDVQMNQDPASGGASRFPSPPSSSSPPSDTSSGGARPQHGTPGSTPSATRISTATLPLSESISSASSTSTATTVVAASGRTMPSPDSDSGSRWNPTGDSSIPTSLPLDDDRPSSPTQTQTTIRVRDLAHIQSLARADLLTATGPGILNDPPLQQMKYEISAMPIGDIIEMVAALLTKITTTNDLQHDALNRNATHVKQAQAQAKSEEGSGEGNMSPLSSSVLAFHGKNVPAITILSYLSRIHKYCPTTYEVFLSLLVYFDRMTERVNDMVMKSEEARRLQMEAAQALAQQPKPTDTAEADSADTVMRDDDATESDETDSELADTDDDDASPRIKRAETGGGASDVGATSANTATIAAASQATYFVVDSFNIHRLIIAGVTCASKFFSDVFYTNSRYAKVGGLPLAELNHLELQFLLLNDFRLAVPVEDLEAYATMLVEFYAREVIAQRSRPNVSAGMD